MTDEGLSLEPPHPWMAMALCATADPDAWHADIRSPAARTARDLCREYCGTAGECFTYSMTLPDDLTGIYAGLTERDRAEIRRRLRRQA